MSISTRYYIFAPGGLQRISHRVMEGLCRGDDAMPQFADTKQRVADVSVEIAAGKSARIVNATGSFLCFDKEGKVNDSLLRGGIEAIETFDALERSKMMHPSKIID